ncbi:hypothetical protein D3C79_583220 [compost metagenome]
MPPCPCPRACACARAWVENRPVWASFSGGAVVAPYELGAGMATRYRDAVSGEYITEEKAKRNPRESVKETDKKKPTGGGKGGKGKK